MHVWKPSWDNKTETQIAQINGQKPLVQSYRTEPWEWTSQEQFQIPSRLRKCASRLRQQHEARNANKTPASEVPAAIRLWWCNVLTSPEFKSFQ